MDGKVGHTVLVVSVVRRKRRRRGTRWHHNADGAPHMDLRRRRAVRRTLQLKLGRWLQVPHMDCVAPRARH